MREILGDCDAKLARRHTDLTDLDVLTKEGVTKEETIYSTTPLWASIYSTAPLWASIYSTAPLWASIYSTASVGLRAAPVSSGSRTPLRHRS